jgi:peroxiredoxin
MISIGKRVPGFTLPNVDDTQVSLDDLLASNRAVAVIFSCNHCPYVRGWEGRMKAIQADYADRGVQLVAINPNDAVKYPEDSFTEMKKRYEAEGFNFLYLRDESQDVARAYAAGHTPEVFLLDSEGTLRYHGRIDDNYSNPQAVVTHDLRNALGAVLAGQEPPVTETTPVGCTIKWK